MLRSFKSSRDGLFENKLNIGNCDYGCLALVACNEVNNNRTASPSFLFFFLLEAIALSSFLFCRFKSVNLIKLIYQLVNAALRFVDFVNLVLRP